MYGFSPNFNTGMYVGFIIIIIIIIIILMNPIPE